jgi:P-type Cu+ transporter
MKYTLTSKVHQLWALVYNIAAIPIAAGFLYPIRHIRLDPVWASLAMALS